MHSYCNVNAYIPFAAHYISWHLFYSWKFTLLNLPHLFCSPPSYGNNQLVLCIMSHFCLLTFVHLVFFFFFLGFINKWNYIVFVFPWLIPLSVIPSRSIQVVVKGKVHLFCDWVLFHYIYLHIYVTFFIHYILDISNISKVWDIPNIFNISCILMDSWVASISWLV